MESALKPDLLRDKVAFVTGGTSGINLAIAERYAQAGAKVCVIGRNKERAEAARAKLEAYGTRCLALTADVRLYDGVAAVMQQAHDELGAFDVLVNGAAGNFPAPALGMSANGFKSVVDIDLLGTYNACRAAFDHLVKPGASIINISAPQAWVATALQVHVCAAKAGVDMVTRVLAIEWGPMGVRVNSIAPGPIDDTEGMRRLASTDELRQKAVDSVPLRRFGEKADIAELALFLASPSARYISGAVLSCDGGQSLVGFGPNPLG